MIIDGTYPCPCHRLALLPRALLCSGKSQRALSGSAVTRRRDGREDEENEVQYEVCLSRWCLDLCFVSWARVEVASCERWFDNRTGGVNDSLLQPYCKRLHSYNSWSLGSYLTHLLLFFWFSFLRLLLLSPLFSLTLLLECSFLCTQAQPALFPTTFISLFRYLQLTWWDGMKYVFIVSSWRMKTQKNLLMKTRSEMAGKFWNVTTSTENAAAHLSWGS